METLKKDFLSLYKNPKELIIDLQNMSNIIDYKNITYERSLETQPYEQLFADCHSSVSFLLPKDCKNSSLKGNYPELYNILFYSCLMTALCTIEEFLTNKKIVSLSTAYCNVPDKLPYDEYEHYFIPSGKKIGILTDYQIATSSLHKINENSNLPDVERDWSQDNIKNKLKKNRDFSKSRKNTLTADIAELQYHIPGADHLIIENFYNRATTTHLRHTNLGFSLFLLRHNNVTKTSFLQLEHKLVKMKLFLQRLEKAESKNSTYTLSKDDIKKAKKHLKDFLTLLEDLYTLSYFYKEDYQNHYSADTIFTAQKRILLFAPDILNYLFEQAGTPSMLFEKGVTSYLAKTISIPFSRDTIISTFYNKNGLINICALEDFFKGYYPTLVRLFLFALFRFPNKVKDLETQLENVKANLLSFLQAQHDLLQQHTKVENNSIFAPNSKAINFTKKMNTLPITPQPTNELLEKIRMQRRAVLSNQKVQIEAPSNNSLIKLMAAICELYSTCPAQVAPHPMIDYNAPMDNYFSLLQQAKVAPPNSANDILAYNQEVYYSLCQLNIKNCHLLFKNKLWEDYLKSFDARKEKFISIMDMGVFISPNISYTAAQNIENRQLQQLVYDYIEATNSYSSLHNRLICQFDISDREKLPVRLTLGQHELFSITANPFYTIEEPSEPKIVDRLGT